MGTHPIFESDFDCLTGMSEVEVSSSTKTSNFTIVQEPISSSDEDVAEECSPSSVTETLFIPVIDLQSDPKPVKPKTYPEKSQGPREIPVAGRKRKRKSNSVEVDNTNVIEILKSSNCYKKKKRTERKKKQSKSDTTFEDSEIIDLISDEEVDKTPPRNSMQIKRWKTILEKLHSKSQITQWKEGFINRMSKSPNGKKIKLDQSILKHEPVGDNEPILNIRKLKNNHFDKDLKSKMQTDLAEKRKDKKYFDDKFKDAKASFERANKNRFGDYSFQEKKQRERARNDAKDAFIKLDQEVQTISEQLYGISRCKYDLCQAGAEADDTIYVTEKILGKFYPSREDKSEANTKNMIEDLLRLKKLSGRRYYEEIENNRIQKENEIFN